MVWRTPRDSARRRGSSGADLQEEEIKLAAQAVYTDGREQVEVPRQKGESGGFDLEPEPLLISDGSHCACWVIYEAAVVEDANQAVFHVLPTSEPVQERSRIGRAEAQGHGVDGEVPTRQVLF